MKKKRVHHYFTLLLLLSFVFVQLPFSAFHHHETIECSVINKERHNDPVDAHFHNQVHDDCFVCAGCMFKDLALTSDQALNSSAEVFFLYSSSDSFLCAIFTGHTDSRAPPVA